MPGRKKGSGNESPKKGKESSKTRSKIKKQRQKELSNSLASISFPVKPLDPKELSPVREGRKLSSINNTSPQK